MRYKIVFALVLLWLGQANAEVSSYDDVALLIIEVCDTPPPGTLDLAEKASLTAFCGTATQKVRGAQPFLPSSYYKTKLGVDWCTVTATVTARMKLEAVSHAAQRLSILFQCPAAPPLVPRGGAGPVGVIASGAADFFFAYALQEVIDYVVQDYLKVLCKKGSSDEKLTTVELFKHSCAMLFPVGGASDPTYDSTILHQLKKSLLLDLEAVVQRVWDYAGNRAKAKNLDPRVLTGLGLVVTGAAGVIIVKKRPVELLRKAADYARDHLPAPGDPHVCVLDPASNAWFTGHRARCLALLAAELVRAFNPQSVTQSLDIASKTFCSRYGTTTGDNDAKCLFDGMSWSVLQQQLVAVAKALSHADEMFDLARNQPLSSDTWSRVAASLIEMVAEVRKFVDTTQLDSVKEIGQTLDLAASLAGFAFASAIRDSNAMRTYLIAALSNVLVSSRLSTKASKIVTFVFSLYEAKDRSDVKAILEEVAAPVGTYRRKYDLTESAAITINGWVGGYGGYALRFHDAEEADRFVGGLTIPIGVDFQPASLSGKRARLSFGLTVLDPLGAAQLDKSKEIPNAKLVSIINAGAHVTLGIARSPFVLRAGVDYKPGLQSETMCGDESCYRGSLLFSLGFAVEVPFLVLR